MRSEDEIRNLVARIVDEAVSSSSLSLSAQGKAGEPIQTPARAANPSTSQPAAASEIRGVAIGADHGGFALKEQLVAHLGDRGYRVTDCGTDGNGAVDYPDFAHAVAREVASGRCQAGVIVDGAGIGSSMAANKVPGVRAALCYDISSARNSREHNHANVLTLGAGLIGNNLARQILDTWLETPWGGARHARRVAKIDAIERDYSKHRE